MARSATKKKHKLSLEFFKFACSCATVIVLLLSIINLNNASSKKEVLGQETSLEQLQTEKTYWENVVADNPTYMDGWIELSRIYKSLGDTSSSQKALNEARKINPNSDKLIGLQ